jgi:hypothetical protein
MGILAVLVGLGVAVYLILRPNSQTTRVPAGAETKPAKEERNTLWPVAIGNEWHYKELAIPSNREQQKVRKITQSEVHADEQRFVVELTVTSSSAGTGIATNMTSREFWGITKASLILYTNTVTANNTVGQRAFVFTPPRDELRFPIVSGRSWDWEGDLGGGMVAKIVSRVEGEEEVVVPAGKFRAYRITSTTFDKKQNDQAEAMRWISPNIGVEVQPVFTLVRWFAKDVGIIKEMLRRSDVELTSILISYTFGNRQALGPERTLAQPASGSSVGASVTPPRRTILGHWIDVGTKHVADNPAYRSTTDDTGGGHLYISQSEAWRVEPGEAAVRMKYNVAEENPTEYWLDMCLTAKDGTKIYSRVSFSPDRQQMYVTTRHDLGRGLPADIASTVRSQVGGSTTTTTYKRVDDQTAPAGSSAKPEPSQAETSRSRETEPGSPQPQTGLDWLPKYPSILDDHSSKNAVNFLTEDSVSEVLAFYREKLTLAGFSVDTNPRSGSFATIGGGKSQVLKAERREGSKVFEFELIAMDQNSARAVYGKWRTYDKP